MNLPMMRMKTPIPEGAVKGIDVVVSLNGKPLAGMLQASFVRTARLIDITNKIDGAWEENLTGTKSWKITGNGFYLVNKDCYDLLNEAFNTNTAVAVTFDPAGSNYHGTALISKFSNEVAFDAQLKYSLELVGTGAIEK